MLRQDPKDCLAGSKRALVAAALAAGGLVAAPYASAIEPDFVRWGSVYVQPTLDMEYSWVDNLYRTSDDEVDAQVLHTMPAVEAWLADGNNRYSLLYQMDDARYDGTPSGLDDDYTAHLFRTDVHHEFNARNLLELFAEHDNGYDERGTILTEGGAGSRFDEPLEYVRSSYGGQYSYGTSGAKGKLQLAAERQELDYQNFYDDYTKYFDYDEDLYRGTFFWALSAKTSALIELAYDDVVYERSQPGRSELDAEEYRLYLGLDWEASSRTRGTLKLGAYDRDMSADDREDSDGFAWEVGVNFRHRTYSIWEITTRQTNYETNGYGDYIDSREHTLDWTYTFRRGVRSRFSGLLANDDFGGVDREDDRLRLEWVLDYPFRRWLDAGVGLRYEDRDSNVDFYTYTREEIFVTLSVSL